MNDLAFVKEFTPGAIGVWTLVAMAVLALIRAWPALARLRVEADGSLRKDLLSRITALEEQRTIDRRECLEEQEQLHQRIREQEKVIDGLQRQLIMFQITVAEALPPERRSPEILSMLKQLVPLMTHDGERK